VAKVNMQIVIGAPAGLGVMTAGLLLSKTLLKAGYYVYDYQEYPSLIKGGNNSYFINFSDKEIRSAKQKIDILICLDKLTYDTHEKSLNKGAVIIYNKNKFELGRGIGIPASDLVKKLNAPEITVNNLLLGVVCKILNVDINILNEYITKQFDEKHKDLVDENLLTVKAGYDFTDSTQINADYKPINADKESVRIRSKSAGIQPRIMLTGNEAISLGAIKADCRFYSAYPMTPSSAILHYLAAHQEQTGMIVKHPEDEISALNMAIGASFAGVRSAVGTSGGGFALMVEAVGLAGITETPVVIFMGQRTGPSTGLPTYTGQGDLNFILNTSHGEFPRVIICPGDVEEMYYLTQRAFNAADLLQTPVFILFDKALAESHENIELNQEGEHNIAVNRFSSIISQEKIPQSYKRYPVSSESASARSIPGQENGQYLSNSYEHDEVGFATESSEMTKKQMEKRMKKYDLISQHAADLDLHLTKYFGAESPDLLIVSWGSNKGVIRDAIDALPDKKIGFLQIVCAKPLDAESIKKYLVSAKKVVGIECNYQGQMCELIHGKTGFVIKDRLLKYDGRQFLLDEIIAFINASY
jgi:2-oxoglutarate ferredoxin oxidoreductase subunit alpha